MGSAEPEVSTTYGRVRGRIEHGNAVFRGLPFARPPLFGLRFQAPAPPAAWDGVRDAGQFGPQSPQAAFPAADPALADPAPGAPERPADTTGGWLTVKVWTPD